MPAPNTRLNSPPAPKGGGHGLSARVGGYPLYVWGAGLLLAIGIGLYFKHRAASSATTAGAPVADTGAAGSGGGGSVAPDSTSQLADAINGLTGMIGAGGFQTSSDPGAVVAPSFAPASFAPTATQPWVSSTNPGTIYVDPATGNTFALQPSGALQPAYVGPGGSYVSPGTYAGLGVSPENVTGPKVASLPGAAVQPPHSLPPVTSTAIAHPAVGQAIGAGVKGGFTFAPAPAPKPGAAPTTGKKSVTRYTQAKVQRAFS